MHRFLNLAAALLLPLAGLVPDDADDLVQYIDGLYDRGLHDMVAREAEDFLDDHPKHGERDRVRYRLASSLFELGRPRDALPHYRRLAQQNDFDYQAESALRLGQCALETDDLDEARGALELVLSLDADYLHVPANYLLAETDFRAARYAAAEPRFAAVLSADGDGVYAQDARSSLAWCAFRLGRADQAVTRAQQLLDRNPPAELAAEMRFVQGEAHLETGRPVDALRAYGRVTSGPFADAALRGAAFAHSELGDHAAAATAFERLLDTWPDSRFADEARLQLGIQRLQAGDADGAAQALADRRLAGTAEVLYWRARADADRGRHEQALEQLDRALAARPDEELAPHIHTARGDALTALGRTRTAAAAYEQAGSLDAMHAAAVTRLNEGEHEEALRLVTPLLGRPDADADLHLTHAETLFALERWDEAHVAFTKARATKDPALRRRVDSRLAWCAWLSGDTGAAATAFDALAKSAPDSPEGREAFFMAGRAHRQLGEDQAAVVSWTTYAGLRPFAERRAEALLGLSELTPSPKRERWLELLVTDHEDSPFVPGAIFSLAESAAQAGRCKDAEPLYARVVERHGSDPVAPAARYGYAFCLVERGAVDEAAALLEPLVAQEPSRDRRGGGTPVARAAVHEAPVDPALRAAALELLVWCRHEQGDPQGAEAAWRDLAAAGVDGTRVAASGRTVAAAWRAADRPDRALELLDEIGTTHGAGADALVEGAWIALDEGALDVAAERVDLALRQDADGAAVAEIAFFLGEAYFAGGDDARAVKYYGASAAAGNGTLGDEALYKQGFAYLRRDDAEPAAACFASLVARYPTSELVGESLFLQGEALYRLGRYDEAIAPLNSLLQEHPRHDVVPKTRFRLGLSLAQAGRCDEAEGVLARLAQQSPDFPNLAEAELWRGRCLADQQRTRAAQSAYERVLQLDQGVLAARARLGLGHMRLGAGETEDALAEFLKVALLFAHDEEVAEALFMAGQCLEQMGQADPARERYREVLDEHPQSSWTPRARQRLSAM